MSYQDFTTAIKHTIERTLNLGAKFCVELAVKVGVFRGRIVVMRQFESQIEPQQLGGPDKYIRYRFGGSERNQWQVTSDTVEGVQKGKDIYWFTTKFDAELNKIIPDNLKYLRKEALKRACKIFETAIEEEKTKEEAMKEVKDSNILIEYSKKVDKKEKMNWFIIKFNDELNKIIPENMKYLRDDALEEACEKFEIAIEQEKTKEEAMKEVIDSIQIKYSKEAAIKIAENNLIDELFDPERKSEIKNEDVSEML